MRVRLIFMLGWFAAGIASGQKLGMPTGKTGFFPAKTQKALSDTLDSHFVQATPTLYASPNGGYASGNSGYGETAKLQEFHLKKDAYTVAGFLYWFARKSELAPASDSSALIFIWHDLDSGATVYDSNRVVPHSVFERDTVLLSNIDTSSVFGTALFYWEVTPREVNRNYAAGFLFHRLAEGDTIALWSSTDGDPPRKGQSWEFWNGAWRPILHTWNLDIDLAVFPVLDLSTGFEETEIIGLSIFPNPVVSALHLRRKNGIQVPGKVKILSINGALVDEAEWPANVEELQLNTEKWPSGTLLLVTELGGKVENVFRLVKTP